MEAGKIRLRDNVLEFALQSNYFLQKEFIFVLWRSVVILEKLHGELRVTYTLRLVYLALFLKS